MQRWEYKMVVSQTTLFFAAIKSNEIVQALNKDGVQGWEVTGIIEAAVGSGITHEVAILLKRPLPS